MTYWVNTVCLDHARVGVREGIVQADHGKPDRLRRLARGDGIVLYSPRTSMRSGTPVQEFTALGHVTDEECYQVQLTATFHPWRRHVNWYRVDPAPVAGLRDRLSFVPEGRSWGMPFRRGLLTIPAADFATIARAMNSSPAMGWAARCRPNELEPRRSSGRRRTVRS
ncbi:EVE domain-containing protein [Ruania alba]|uniref:UPF0310 protein SAMN04488554_3672 n=1 Tax=Ruania alba TaxID=648782 RepID=A0A1H5MWY5_9MICO|nr:EVE domain-containing protein [Ruania alba]SEE93237.1 EVE domain-containing protein [Ruania alba]